MTEVFSIYIKYFFFFITLYTCLYLVGLVILRLFKLNFSLAKITTIFASVFIGVIVFNVIYACLRTYGKTVQILFIIALVFAFIEYLKNKKSTAKSELIPGNSRQNFLKHIVTLLGAGMLIYTLCFVAIVKIAPFPYIMQVADDIFYSNYSFFLNVTHQENSFNNLNLLDPDYQGPKPGHYFDIWLNAGAGFFFGGSYLLHLMLNTYPVFYLLVFTGILAVFENFTTIKLKHIILSFLLLWLGGIYFLFITEIPFCRSISTYVMSAIFGMPKLIYYYAFGIAFFLLYKNGLRTIAFVTLFSVCIATITAVPSMVLGYVIFIIIAYRWKLEEASLLKKISLYVLTITIAIGLFYYFFDKATINQDGSNLRSLVNSLLLESINPQNLKIRFNIIGSAILQSVIVYSPFILAIILLRRRLHDFLREQNSIAIPFLMICCIYVSGILAWAFMYKNLNGVALFYNSGLSLLNTALIIYSIVIYVSVKGKRRIIETVAFSIIILVCVYRLVLHSNELSKQKDSILSYSDQYIDSIQNYFFMHQKTPAGVSFCDSTDHSTQIFSYYHMPLGAPYLSFIRNGALPVKLCDFEFNSAHGADFEIEREKSALELGIFYRFVNKQKKQSDFFSLEESQKKFIKMHSIDYAVLSKHAKIPSFLEGHITHQFTDSLSGQRFIIFRDI